MVLHDLAQAFRTADEIVVMDEGRVKACGKPEEVYESDIVDEVFGVEFRRIQVNGEWRYFCG